MAPTPATGSLVLAAAVDGRSVWYTVHPSSTDRKTVLKTARFSELYSLHESLKVEVPKFPGVFPSKTWGRKTSVAFVESRRKDLELYLRLVATHPAAMCSLSWITFIDDVVSLSWHPPKLAEDADEYDVDWETNTCTWSSSKAGESFKKEMGSILCTKKDELSVLQEAKQELERSIASGEEAAQASEAEAKERAALEAKAAGCLRRHRLNLEELEAKLADRKSKWSDKSLRQNELVNRFDDKLSSLSESVKAAKSRLESSQRACAEASAKTSSQVGAAVAIQVEAETSSLAATEGHAALTAALVVLTDSAKSQFDDFKAAERELNVFNSTEKMLVAESSEAEMLRCSAESDAIGAVTAVSSHTSDAARRNRAFEVEVRRAEERHNDLVALRDMHTRGLLVGEDRSFNQEAGNIAIASAEAAAEAVVKSTQLHEETKAKDRKELESLQAAVAKTHAILKNRQAAASALAARAAGAKVQLQKASTKCASLGAAHQAVDKELQIFKQQVQVLAEPLGECAHRLEDAQKAVEAARRKGSQEQTVLQHAVEADTQLLTRLQAEEASLVLALDEARRCVAETRKSAGVPSENTEVEEAQAKIDLQRLMREELAIVDAELQRHEENERDLRAEAEQKLADWMKLQSTLSADLHVLEMECNVAKLNAQASKELAVCLLST